jgi:DNA-binding NarL/FixJ family response regulator
MNFVVRQRIVVGNEPFPKLGTDTDLTRHAVPPRTLTCVYWKELTHIPESPQTDMSVPGRSVITRILVLEEHPLLRGGITDFLNAQPDLEVCGEADNIRDARNEITKCKPHLLVTALRLGTGDSLEFVKALKAEKPELLILVYSAFEEAIFAERTLRAGADGYVMKTAPKEEFLGAIRDVLNGNIYVSRNVAMRAFKRSLESRPDHRSAPSALGIEKLSDREMHIFNLLGSGLGNTQIAHSLSLSVKTIESHRENIKRKLDLSCSRDLIACAKKYVEETFLPAAKGAVAMRGKKKVVRFPAA